LCPLLARAPGERHSSDWLLKCTLTSTSHSCAPASFPPTVISELISRTDSPRVAAVTSCQGMKPVTGGGGMHEEKQFLISHLHLVLMSPEAAELMPDLEPSEWQEIGLLAVCSSSQVKKSPLRPSLKIIHFREVFFLFF